VIFGGVRLLRPASSNLFDLHKYLAANLSPSRENLDLLVMLSSAVLLLIGRRRVPAPEARLALCAIPWLLLHFFSSRWYEIRYYMPVLIWLLPGVLCVLSGVRADRGTRSIR